MDLTIFDNDERIILNGMTENTSLSKLTRERLLSQLAFAIDACADAELRDVLEGLVTKLENASDREWEEVRTHLPFEVFAEVAPGDI